MIPSTHTILTVPALGLDVSPKRRSGKTVFWALFGLEAALIAVVLGVLLAALPARAPLAMSTDVTHVREAIVSRLNGTVSDSILEVAPGVTARASNIRGLALGGETYYYYLEGAKNFDPLSRAVVAQDGIEVLLRDTSGPHPLVIYRLMSAS